MLLGNHSIGLDSCWVRQYPRSPLRLVYGIRLLR